MKLPEVIHRMTDKGKLRLRFHRPQALGFFRQKP